MLDGDVSFVRVLLMVILIPSKLCTIYSLLLFTAELDVDVDVALLAGLIDNETLSLIATVGDVVGRSMHGVIISSGICGVLNVGVDGGESSETLCADFNLSITALSEPLRFFVA